MKFFPTMSRPYKIASVAFVSWTALLVAMVVVLKGGNAIVNQDYSVAAPVLRYVAVGDSYTAATGIDPELGWPLQLIAKLAEIGVNLEMVANLAQAGWTSSDVIANVLPRIGDYPADIITLQIGANDVVQGVTVKEFETNLRVLINGIIARTANREKILILNIPDFTATEVGKSFGDKDVVVERIMSFNQIIETVADEYNVPVVNVFELSRQMEDDPSLVALDNLHPSEKEYAKWVSEIFPQILNLLKR